MSDLNADLTGGELDAFQLAADLRAAHARLDALTQSLSENNAALGRIAAAAGLLDFETLTELADGVIGRLNGRQAPPTEHTAMLSPPLEEPAGPPYCEVCGGGGAVDIDGAVLCPDCSGDCVIAEGLPT
jgi:hypothetical protein